MRATAFLCLCLAVVASSIPETVVNTDMVSVSGLSSGAFMAVQYHVAHSSDLMGAGIVAGGPYYCANNHVSIALTACMTDPELIVVDELIAATLTAQDSLQIDDTSNLANDNVFIFSGSKDTIVDPGVVAKLIEYYEHYIPSSNIASELSLPVEHAWITTNFGNNCTALESPYINQCNYDMSGAILAQIYGQLKPKGTMINDNLYQFDQSKYIPPPFTPDEVGLQSVGFVYIPTNCTSGNAPHDGCNLHMAFHGCHQDITEINSTFYMHVGLNEWAETNSIIVVYPQAAINDLNPDGCFDWWGYSGITYPFKEGYQISTFKATLDAIIGGILK